MWIQPLGREDPGIGNGNPLQYFCLENSIDRGVWRATVHGVAKSQTRLSNEHYYCSLNYGENYTWPCTWAQMCTVANNCRYLLLDHRDLCFEINSIYTFIPNE